MKTTCGWFSFFRYRTITELIIAVRVLLPAALNKDNLMRKLVLPLLIATVLMASCTQSPTGRRQLMLFDDKKLSAMGIQTFEGMKAETPISKNKKVNQYVQCVANGNKPLGKSSCLKMIR
jgi:hypothetical protein